MRKLILMLVFLTGARFECPSVLGKPPKPPFQVPYIQANICPTECCVYRTWTAREDLIAHRAPSMAAPILFRIPNKRKFLAVTGDVVTVKPGITVVRRTEGTFAKGDTLWVLSADAKGGFTVWHRGRLRNVELAKKPDASPETGEATAGVEETGLRANRPTPFTSQWWVKVHFGAHRGWIRVDPADPGIDGLSNCK